MRENKAFIINIVQYLNDPSDQELEKEVNRFRAASMENDEFYLEIERVWSISPEVKHLDALNTEDALERLSNRLGYSGKNRGSGRWNIWYAAAAVAVLFIAGYWGYSTFTEAHYITKTTGTAIDSVLLPDGSKIYLSKGTTVRYPEKMKAGTRSVFLVKGAAFFDIVKKANQEFVVAVESSKVTVLGTSFNVKNEHKQIELAVRSGKIKFEAPDGNSSSVLTAGDGLIYSSETGRISRFTDKAGTEYAWLTHELKFVDTPLPEVFKILEKCYGVKFRYKDSLSSFNKFNANFKDNKLEEILEILRETYPLQISREDSVLVVQSN